MLAVKIYMAFLVDQPFLLGLEWGTYMGRLIIALVLFDMNILVLYCLVSL